MLPVPWLVFQTITSTEQNETKASPPATTTAQKLPSTESRLYELDLTALPGKLSSNEAHETVHEEAQYESEEYHLNRERAPIWP